MTQRTIAFDCRYFLGDRPCRWHKLEGAVCECSHYDKVAERILIIKLDAMGDVLRTTALLPAIAAAHPGAAIAWVTRAESVPLLANNPFITETIAYGADASVCLGSRKFDRVINLDAGRVSAGLAAIAKGDRKDGFVLDSDGSVRPTNAEARAWLEAGVFDDVKRAWTSTYQDTMLGILHLDEAPHHYVLNLTEDERRSGLEHLRALGADGRPMVGFNTGAGGRWQLKQWREEGFRELAAGLIAQNVQVVLLGGPSERERNDRLKMAVPGIIDPGSDNAVRHFASLVAACDVVVTGDTLAMHIALATRRRTIVLFGPTSAVEIELYGFGEKILPELTCLGCYKNTCDFVPNCMDEISTETVLAAVRRQLALTGTSGQ